MSGPNTPGSFTVWYRNETTLLVIWQPPSPPGVFTHYKAQIEPPDAIESVVEVSREGEPPRPGQAAFHGLTPGKAYNISVETASGDGGQRSCASTAQYRTVPLRPGNVNLDTGSIPAHSFRVRWEPPSGQCVFDRYQALIKLAEQEHDHGRTYSEHSPVSVPSDGRREATFGHDLDRDHSLAPGRTYTVSVKAYSGKVASWPVTLNVTTRPLPVQDCKTKLAPE